MTFLDDKYLPVRGRRSSWSELGNRYYQKRYFQKRYLCFWILAAFFPFMLLRLVFLSDVNAVPSTKSPAAKTAVTVKTDLPFLKHISIISGSPPSRPDRDLKAPVTHKSSLLQSDQAVWSTHNELARHGNSPLVESPGTYTGPSPDNVRGVVKAKNAEVGHPPLVPDVYFGLPEDNENEDPVAWVMVQKEQEEKKIGKDTTAQDRRKAEEEALAQRKADEQRDAEKRLVNEKNAAKGTWETEQQKRTGEQKEAARKKGNDVELAAEQRKAEAKREGEQKQGNERRGAEEKDAANKQAQESLTKNAQEQNQPAKEKEKEEKYEDGHGVTEETVFFSDVDKTKDTTPQGECDLFDGDWEYDHEGPLYTNSTCFYIQGLQNCMLNGRPDKEYLHWKWKPRNCDLPRFDARAFLEAFKGKTIGFVGDSLARNQMQSLLCILSQIEVPTLSYQSADESTVRWLYEQHQVTLAVVWSPYLLKESTEGIMGFEKGQSVLYVDVLDTFWTSVMQDFDIIILSIGQWYFKPSVYIQQDEVIGCHYCPTLNLTEVGFDDVYRGGVRQVLDKMAMEFKGIVIMSTFAISHFEDGSWDNGGQCRRERPLAKEEGARFPGFHNQMHDIVLDEFNRIANDKSKVNENVKLEFLDVTKVSLLRADGHPGPYRRAHPYEGKNPDEWVPNDCLHWCLPGPVDTWNQLLVKLVQKHL